jgi:hypothetical protein
MAIIFNLQVASLTITDPVTVACANFILHILAEILRPD